MSIWGFLQEGLLVAVRLWWAWLPVLLAVAAYQAWFDYRREAYIAGIDWVLLEVVPPPDVPLSSPRAAENIFAGLHAAYKGGTSWKGQFFKGEVPDWISFEFVSNGGDIHFFIRCTKAMKNVVESLIFAQYPEAEIRVVPDYVDLVPESFQPDAYDAFITELIFTKDHAYPIKTYPEFEEAGGKDEHARLDPIAPLMESMSALQPGEHLWLQLMIRPTGIAWVKESKKVVNELVGKAEKKPDPPLEGLFSIGDQVLGIESGEKKEEKKDEFSLQKLTPTQKRVLESVEEKLSKLAFKSGIRLAYIARKESFSMSRISSVTAMFKQLYYNNLNSFKPNSKASSKDKGILYWLFPSDKGFRAAERTLKKKKKLYEAYRAREFTEDFNILNTEELATLWHLPGLNVRAPLLPRVQAKKGQPPTILPVREENEPDHA